MAHWAKITPDETTILKTIVVNGKVAGNLVAWKQSGESKVGYWLGKEYWGQGIASEALSQFLVHVKTRPLYARVAKQNVASIRVLQKCGFTMCGEDTFTDIDGEVAEEFILALGEQLPRPTGMQLKSRPVGGQRPRCQTVTNPRFLGIDAPCADESGGQSCLSTLSASTGAWYDQSYEPHSS